MSHLPDADLLDAIRADPDDGSPWLNLAKWFQYFWRDDEATAVRAFWRTLSDSLHVHRSLEAMLDDVRRNASLLGCAPGRLKSGR